MLVKSPHCAAAFNPSPRQEVPHVACRFMRHPSTLLVFAGWPVHQRGTVAGGRPPPPPSTHRLHPPPPPRTTPPSVSTTATATSATATYEEGEDGCDEEGGGRVSHGVDALPACPLCGPPVLPSHCHRRTQATQVGHGKPVVGED